MQTTETTKRKYFTKDQKRKILDELRSHGMTISVLARKHDIHPVTVHKWKREMGSSKKNNTEAPISRCNFLITKPPLDYSSNEKGVRYDKFIFRQNQVP